MNYVLNEEKMFADITDGVAIVINSETGIYYGMNEFGTAVYEALVGGANTEAVLNAVKGLENAPADMEDRFNNFVKAMVDFELIIEGAESNADVNIDIAVAKECEYELKVDEYNDAQEMLLSDPIHEVKEDEGWTPETDSIGYTKEETKEREGKMEE